MNDWYANDQTQNKQLKMIINYIRFELISHPLQQQSLANPGYLQMLQNLSYNYKAKIKQNHFHLKYIKFIIDIRD